MMTGNNPAGKRQTRIAEAIFPGGVAMAGAAAVAAHSRAGRRTGRDGRGRGDRDDPAHAAPSGFVAGCDDEDDGPPTIARRRDRCQNL